MIPNLLGGRLMLVIKYLLLEVVIPYIEGNF